MTYRYGPALGAVAAGLWLAGCAGARLEPREPTPGRPHLSVMSYNVNFGIPCDEPTLDVIAGSGVDAVFLQETTPAWETCLRERLGGSHPHIAFRHGPGAGGLAVLSKVPFDEGDHIPSPIGWFAGWRVTLRTAMGEVQVLQVHLRPQVSDSGSYVSGYLSTGHYREREIREYTPALDAGRSAIVLGDFNEEGGGAIEHLEAMGMRDVLEDFDLGTTWRWPTVLGTLTMQLDHVFYRGAMRPLNARVIEAGRSDHLPIVVAFEGA